MGDLAARITASLSDPRCEPWFPELTEYLTLCEWKRLHKEIGIVPETYSTARILQRSTSICGDIKSSFEYSFSLKTPNIKIEAAQQQWANSYSKAGIRFYSTAELENTSVLACIGDALEIISRIPTLAGSINHLVRSMHVIRPPDAEQDVSFSEPYIPFSIFISVFEERVRNDGLRVAEAIVHEAMHLQLTMIENIVRLVSRKDSRYYSPWRHEYRNAQSLLHGLYVFRVIAQFLTRLLAVSESVDSDYASIRLQNITAEINQIHMFSQCSELTLVGSRLVNRLIPN